MSGEGTLSTSQPGTIIRRALIIETIATLAAAGFVLGYPTAFLNMITSSSTTITPLAVSMTQWFGALTLALSIGCALTVPNTRGAVQARPVLYWMLGGGEIAMCALFLWQMSQGMEDGLSRDGLWLSFNQVMPPIAWRAFVLFVKPHWFGKWVDAGKDE